jgi:hypothetical protein
MEASRPILAALALVALLAAGCVAPSNPSTTPPASTPTSSTPAASCAPVAPKTSSVAGVRQDSVSNTPGAFSDSGQVAGASGTAEYAWQDASGNAMISWGGQSASGSFVLTLLDACGKQVYQQTFNGASQGGGNQNAKPGQPGAWLVRLEYSAFTGQMGLSITG